MTSKSKSKQSEQTLGSMTGKRIHPVRELPAARLKFKETVTSTTMAGVEFEVENAVGKQKTIPQEIVDLYTWCWTQHQDGSLRNHGLEFVSNTGLTAAQVTMSIDLLDYIWRSWFPNVEANARTGTHIHMNCLDLTCEEICSVIALYCVFERTFFKASGNRYKNIFCVPVRESEVLVNKILQKPTEIKNLYHCSRHTPKYLAFNLGALATHGTIEFRHANGVDVPSKILPWFSMVLKFFDYAKEQDYNDLIHRIKNLNTDSSYEALMDEVLPKEVIQQLGTQEIVQDMMVGCSFVKECLINEEDIQDFQTGPEDDPFNFQDEPQNPVRNRLMEALRLEPVLEPPEEDERDEDFQEPPPEEDDLNVHNILRIQRENDRQSFIADRLRELGNHPDRWHIVSEEVNRLLPRL